MYKRYVNYNEVAIIIISYTLYPHIKSTLQNYKTKIDFIKDKYVASLLPLRANLQP